jgi:hypothetical protein
MGYDPTQLPPKRVPKGVDKSLNNCAKPHPDWRDGECLKIEQYKALAMSLAGGMIAAILVPFFPRQPPSPHACFPHLSRFHSPAQPPL